MFASVFTGFGMFFAGMFGGAHASTTMMVHPGPNENAPLTASTTAMRDNIGILMIRSGVSGTVDAMDGTTITVDGRQGTSTATTTYSVDASNAKVIKGSATTTASVSDISVGDHVIIRGTVSGTSVTATTVIDGVMSGIMGGRGFGQSGNASSTRGYRGGPRGQGRVNPGGPMQAVPGANRGQGVGQNGGPGQQ